MKRSPLRRKAPLRARASRDWNLAEINEPGRADFKRLYWDFCVGCGRYGQCRRHHVVLEQHVRRAGGNSWDLRNGASIGLEGVVCQCHASHHAASGRLRLSCLPDDALAFAFELLGAYGFDYLRRMYVDDGDARLVALWGLAA